MEKILKKKINNNKTEKINRLPEIRHQLKQDSDLWEMENQWDESYDQLSD